MEHINTTELAQLVKMDIEATQALNSIFTDLEPSYEIKYEKEIGHFIENKNYGNQYIIDDIYEFMGEMTGINFNSTIDEVV